MVYRHLIALWIAVCAVSTSADAGVLLDPPVLASDNGILDLLMIAKPQAVQGFSMPGFKPIGWVYEVCPRPKDGGVTCPNSSTSYHPYGGVRLALKQGDELKIRLVNNLPAVPPSSLERISIDPLLALNPTNLHMHGFIVPASGNTVAPPQIPTYGDFVFLNLFNYNGGAAATDPSIYSPAGHKNLHAHYDVVYNSLSAVDYDIKIPRDHPSGSFWFHPHVHGISLNQLAAGLSGIVTIGSHQDYVCRDETCGLPIPETSVRHLILKDMQVLANNTPQFQSDPTFCGTKEPPIEPGTVPFGSCTGDAGSSPSYAGGQWFFTINGQQFPSINVTGGAGELWKITNASPTATYDLQLVLNNGQQPTNRKIVFQIIAMDGVALSFPAGMSMTTLQQKLGNRVKVVDCGTISGHGSQPICATDVFMMPATRVEIGVAVRGNARATLRTAGVVTGPGGDTWPEINLASVTFNGGSVSGPFHVKTTAGLTPRTLGGIFASSIFGAFPAPLPKGCKALPPGHRRRIYFGNPNVPDESDGPGSDKDGNPVFGLGYEEIDQFGRPVPGTFVDVVQFDPGNTLCLPLAPSQFPAIETWELINLTTELHNFHIHQTKFAIGENGLAASEQIGVLADTVPLPLAVPGAGSQPAVNPDATSCLISDYKAGHCQVTPVVVQIPFSKRGLFVFHCHILEHEDGGMMHAVRVVASPF